MLLKIINKVNILFILTLTIFLIFYFLYKNNLDIFIGKLNKKLYIFSSIISIIGFFILFIYIYIQDKINDNFIYIFYMLFGFNLWLIFRYYNQYILSIISIIIICISNYFLLHNIINNYNNKYKLLYKLSIYSIYYLLFHHFIIDLFLWSYFNYI